MLLNISDKFTNSSVAPIKPILFKANTGVSKHYFRKEDSKVLHNISNDTSSTKVHLPNNDVLTSNKNGLLLTKGPPSFTKQAHIVPSLTNTSLLYVG